MFFTKLRTKFNTQYFYREILQSEVPKYFHKKYYTVPRFMLSTPPLS